MHRRLVEAALRALPPDRSDYFTDLANRLEQDPRVEAYPNLVFLVLRETVALLPTQLPKDETIELLLGFVARHGRALGHLVYDRRFVENPAILRQLTNELVSEALGIVLRRAGEEGRTEGREKGYRMTFPGDPGDFPYRDDDEENEG